MKVSSAVPTSRLKRVRRKFVAVLAVAATVAATMVSLALPTVAADAATANSCSYGTGGTDASGLCWLDFTGYNDATALGAGQQFTETIPGGYTMSFTLTRTTTTGSPAVAAHVAPTWAGTPFGNSIAGGQYSGIAGLPALYALGTYSTANHAGNWTATLSGIQITDSAGKAVTGWTMVAADAESANNSERETWNTNGNGWQILNSIPALNGGAAACPDGITGTGTTSLVCTGGNGSTTTGGGNNVGDLVVSSSGGPTQISANASQNFNNSTGAAGQSGFAFAISTANITLNKAVAGRVNATDEFTVNTADEGGTQIGTATTTGAATTATTGSKTVIAGSAYALDETASATTDLSNYSQSWSCSNASTGSTTTLPASGATGTTQSVTPQPGDNITCTVTNTPPPASLSLVKSASPSGPEDFTVGQPITYSFKVTNTGGVTLDDLTVTDTDFSGTGTLSAITCPVTTLAPGASTTCTATYTLTQADVNAGRVTNTATANGDTPEGTPVPSNPSSAQIPITPNPSLTLVKTATPTTITAAGDKVTYSFRVTNTGNVTLADVGITETAFSGTGTAPTITCPAGAAALAPGDSVTCTATYTATQADVDAGQITNTATATGTPPTGAPVDSPPSSAVVTATPSPAITIVKSATPSDAAAYTAGQQITYSFLATNTGNVTLTDVTVDDSDFTGTGTLSAISCPETTLVPGASTTCTATYTLTQADIDRGTTTNTATATGTPPTGAPPVSPPSSVTIPATPAPAITIAKTADRTDITAAGQTIHYSFLVTNTGNVTLTDVTVNEGDFTGTGAAPAVTCPASAASLAPGASVTCTATYVTTQADVDNGGVTNTATATGTPPGNTPPPVSPPSTVNVPSTPAPGISVVKTADRTDITAAGQTIHYSFLVTNTGNVTLTDVTVNDSTFTGTGTLSAITCPVTTLAPGASTTCEATYVTTQADVDNGGVTNTATATGTPPGGGNPPVSPPSTVNVPSTPTPAITVVKSADPAGPSDFTVGQQITYSFLVTNTGNVTLTDVTVDDSTFSGTGTLSAITCPAGAASLAPGDSITCTATYTLTQADIDAGKVTNTATATGNPPSGTPPVSPPSNVTIPETPNPAITVVKSADLTDITAAGQTIHYSFLVTNTGNVTLTNPTADDSDFTGTGALSPVDCPTGPLIPGASVTCTATYVTTQTDVDNGGVTNTATATGTPPGDTPPPVSPPSTVNVPSTPTPGISVVKTADVTDITAAGQTITYSFAVTNTGNVTLTDVTVDDSDFTGTGTLSAIACPTTTLTPDASTTCTATYVTTQADVDGGGVTNTATATGTPPGGGTPPVSPPSTVNVPSTPTPGISIVKTADPSTVHHAGDAVTYSFAVTNTGNVTLMDVTVNDTSFSGTGSLSAITCPAGAASLAPGATVTCTATYVVTQADIDAGSITNAATATGTPPGNTPPVTSPPSTAKITAPPAPAITVVKTVSPSGQSTYTVGQKLTYSFVVTNTGNTTLTDVTVNEGDFTGSGQLSAITCPTGAASLAPGDSITCTATYTLTQADIDAGKVTNTATATGTPPETTTPPVSPPSTVTVPSPPAPALTVTKTANVTTITAAGQTITYSFKVTNIGNVTITNPKVDDSHFTGTGKLSAITCPAAAASLAPGASVTCTATYVTTAADVASGKLSNTATVTGTTPGGDPTPPSPPSTVTIPVNVPAPVVSVATGGMTIAPAGTSGELWIWLGLLGAGMIGLAGAGAALHRRRRPFTR